MTPAIVQPFLVSREILLARVVVLPGYWTLAAAVSFLDVAAIALDF
jgi:hypothetical protein